MQHVIGHLYDCVDDPRAIDALLDAFANSVGTGVASFVVLDRESGATVAMRTRNVSPELYNKYPEEELTDPWFVAASKDPTPRVLVGTQLCDQRYVERTPYYTNYLRHLDMRHVIGAGVASSSVSAYLTAHTTRRQPDYSPKTIREVGMLVPHVVRTAKLMINRSNFSEYELTSTLPMVRFGRRGLDFANPRALELLRGVAGVTLLGDRLRFADDVQEALFAAFSSRVLSGDPSRIPAEPLELGVGELSRRLRLLCIPIRTLGQNLQREYMVLVIVIDGAWRLPEHIAGSYGLTPAEVEIANALMLGQSLREHAQRRFRSIHTVRSQAKSLLRKAGVHTQAQLLRKLLIERTPG